MVPTKNKYTVHQHSFVGKFYLIDALSVPIAERFLGNSVFLVRGLYPGAAAFP